MCCLQSHAPYDLHADTPLLSTFALLIAGIVGDDQFSEGLVSGFLLIFFSEIGDKTFFIALLLALREDRTAVFTGTFGALAVMTVISVGLGQVGLVGTKCGAGTVGSCWHQVWELGAVGGPVSVTMEPYSFTPGTVVEMPVRSVGLGQVPGPAYYLLDCY
jgi:hypothetical protein